MIRVPTPAWRRAARPSRTLAGGAAQGDQVDQLVGEGGPGLGAAAGQVVLLDLAGRLLEAVAGGLLGVEVALPRAHAADVQGQERAHDVAGRGQVVGDVDLDVGGDVEAVKVAAGPGRPGGQLVAEPAGVLGREQEPEPAVGQLPGQGQVLRSHGRQVDGQPRLGRGDGQLEGLAGAVGQRQLQGLALVGDPPALQGHPDHGHVVAGPGQGAGEPLPVPALGHLGPGQAEAEPEPPPRQLVEGGRGHGRHGRAPGRDLEHPRPQVDGAGLGGQPGQHGGRVRPVGLGHPGRVVPEPLRLPHQLQLLGRGRPGPEVAEHHPEAHQRPVTSLAKVSKALT